MIQIQWRRHIYIPFFPLFEDIDMFFEHTNVTIGPILDRSRSNQL